MRGTVLARLLTRRIARWTGLGKLRSEGEPMVRMARVGALVCGIMTVASSAAAAPISWLINAQVTTTTPGWAALMPVGAPLSIAFTFDPSVRLVDCGGVSGVYAISAVSVQYAGITRTSTGLAGGIEVNALGANCFPSGFVEFRMIGDFSAGLPNLPPLFQIGFFPNSVNLAAPNLEGVLAGVTGGPGQATNAAGVSAAQLAFQFSANSIQAVPEPGTLGFGVAIVALSLALRRRGLRQRL